VSLSLINMQSLNLNEFVDKQIGWSLKAFGPNPRLMGIVDHIQKELVEIKEKPSDLEEWVDVIILALDGAWRSGHTSNEICEMLEKKFNKNKNRTWPDWKNQPEDKAIEHVRGS